jgi:hypothetical protein
MSRIIDVSPPPRPSTGRRRALALAGIAVVVAGAVAAAVAVAAREQVVSSSSFDNVREIVVEIDAGSIALSRAPGSVVELTTLLAWASTPPTSAAEVVDGVLHIDGDCPDGAVRCSVRHDISVPAGTPVRVRLGAGSVEASSLDVPTLDVRADVGSVAATFATPPAHVSLLTGLGSIALTVPAADYDVDAQAAIGTVAIAIPDVSGAPRTLQVGTRTGSVAVDGS